MSSNVGLLLYGFCNGYFGRDSYCPKRIEGEGVDWIVAREATTYDAEPVFASFKDAKQKQEYIDLWSKIGKEEEG